ncbi:MAG: 16S rRNA (guanine(966)-N(2))-methyltransferase RsmD [Thermacetogeniaceae bacterium]
MSGLRVIGGIAKGRRLKTRKTMNLRPATDFIKEALFNILAVQVIDAHFLDLFAGSGSIGIEALSRGARQAVFVEKDPLTAALIRDNLAITGFTSQGQVYVGDVLKALTSLQKSGCRFDLAFIDPPFRQDLVTPSLARLLQLELIRPGGLIVTRSYVREKAMTEIAPVRMRAYGDSVLRFYSITNSERAFT